MARSTPQTWADGWWADVAGDQVDVPAVGRLPRPWLYAIVAAGAGVVGYAWWRHRASAAPVDPSSPEAQDQAVTAPGATGDASVSVNAAGLPTSTAEWTQAAVDKLGQVGVDAVLAVTALGRYLARQPLSATEQDVVRSALALEGTPPGGALPVITALPQSPVPSPAPAPAPAPAWHGPLTRTAAGPPLMSIRTPAGGRRAWNELIPVFYRNVPPDGRRITRAAAILRIANSWRGRADGSAAWQTVGAGVSVSVPAAIYV